MPENSSKVVISTSANDDFEFKKKWAVDKGKQEKIIDEFNDPNSALKFIIVTAKLLTGFDSPVLQTMYLDKSLKDHTLLQAICRTWRGYIMSRCRRRMRRLRFLQIIESLSLW